MSDKDAVEPDIIDAAMLNFDLLAFAVVQGHQGILR